MDENSKTNVLKYETNSKRNNGFKFLAHKFQTKMNWEIWDATVSDMKIILRFSACGALPSFSHQIHAVVFLVVSLHQ